MKTKHTHELIDEAIADAAYWKGQAKNTPDLLAALILAVPLMQRYAMRSPVLEPSVDRILPAMISAIAQAEGVK
jgi:hypothetical protein